MATAVVACDYSARKAKRPAMQGIAGALFIEQGRLIEPATCCPEAGHGGLIALTLPIWMV